MKQAAYFLSNTEIVETSKKTESKKLHISELLHTDCRVISDELANEKFSATSSMEPFILVSLAVLALISWGKCAKISIKM